MLLSTKMNTANRHTAVGMLAFYFYDRTAVYQDRTCP